MNDELATHDSHTTPEDAGGGAVGNHGRGLVGTVLADRYELYMFLGQGGMGIVMAARDRAMGEDVAVKLLRPELGADRRWAERLGREVKVARQLHHPNVCPVFDLVQANGQSFVVMRLAAESLRAELDRGVTHRSTEDRLNDIAAVAAGLAAVHGAGIVHRDLSAQNVLRMKTGQLAVSDFGLAIDIGRTAVSLEGGTIAYMAPELALGNRASFASDVWAAGIIIYEIAFGHRPLWRGNVLRHGIARPPGRLTNKQADIFDICRACTAEAAADRVAAAALVNAVEQIRGRRQARLFRRTPRRAAVLLVTALASALAVAAAKRWQPRHWVAAPSTESEVIKLQGTAADWSRAAPVLAEVHGRVQCMTLLPDGHTLRFVWGQRPSVAQDLDIRTSRMTLSPIEPRTYRYGCPSLSPDGHLLFEGYDSHGRAAIFSSDHPNGSAASIVAMTDNVRPGSEARWLAGGTAVVMDVDQRHAGIMEMASNHLTVVPTASYDGARLLGWITGTDMVLSLALIHPDLIGIDGYRWPSMSRSMHLIASIISSDLATYDGSILYANDLQRAVVAITPLKHTMTRIGEIPGQSIGYLAPGPTGVGFVSFQLSSKLYESRGGKLRAVTADDRIWEAARCGAHGFLLIRRPFDHRPMAVIRLSETGTRTVLANAVGYTSPACDHTGAVWWYRQFDGSRNTFVRCTRDGCSPLTSAWITAPHLSPDELRLAVLTKTADGGRVQWMSATGGPLHDVAGTETECAPGWASNETLWVSRRHQSELFWAEVDANTGRETGHRVPGSHDCSDTDPDPLSPVDSDMRIVVRRLSQIRWKENEVGQAR